MAEQRPEKKRCTWCPAAASVKDDQGSRACGNHLDKLEVRDA